MKLVNKPAVEFGRAVAFSGRLSTVYSSIQAAWRTREWNEAERVNVQSAEVKLRMRPLSSSLRAGYPEMTTYAWANQSSFRLT